jgi:hypothetical protein
MLANGYVHMLIDGGGTLSVQDWAKKVGTNNGHHKLAPIKPEPWHRDRLKEYEKEIADLRALSNEALVKKETARRKKALKKNAEDMAQAQKEWDICVNMVKEIEAWKAPKVLAELRGYMLQSLKEAIDRGSLVSYYEEERAKLEEPIVARKLRSALLASIKHSIQYHKKGWKEAQAEAKKTNKHIAALASL